MIFISGYMIGLSLIVAIGAQNAFVLRQGLRREHVLPVVLICVISDAILMSVGVAGFDVIDSTMPALAPFLLYGGVAFLLAYGAMRFYAAWKGGEQLDPTKSAPVSLGKTVAMCMAITWLNPHVYLDTVVLVGTISAQYGDQRWLFGAGAITASFSFFFALGYGARLLAPLFHNPVSWRILDVIIGAMMWSIAATLLLT